MPRKASHDAPKKRAKQNTLDSFFGGAPGSSPHPEISAGGNRRKRRGRAYNAVANANGSDDGSQSSDVGAIHFEPTPTPTDEDEPRPPPKRRRLVKRRADSDEDGAHSPTLNEEATSASAAKKSAGNKAVGKQREVTSEQEDDEDAQPRKRKLIKGIRPPSPEEDEEEDLLNEVDENSTPRPLQIRPLLILMLLIHRNYRT